MKPIKKNLKEVPTNKRTSNTSDDDSDFPDHKYYKSPHVRSKSVDSDIRIGNKKEKPTKLLYKSDQSKQNHNYSPQSNVYEEKYKSYDKEMYEVEGTAVKRYPSLICRTINQDGELVDINNEVVRDKVILSCRPRYNVGRSYRSPVVIEPENSAKYIPVPPPQHVSVVPQTSSKDADPRTQYTSGVPQTRYISADPQYMGLESKPRYITPVPQTSADPQTKYFTGVSRPRYISADPQYLGDDVQQQSVNADPKLFPINMDDKEKIKRKLEYQTSPDRTGKVIQSTTKDIIRNVHDREALALAEQLALKEQNEMYEEKNKSVQCKRYTRNFKTFLWALFTINIFLILVVFALLLLTLSHILFRSYISTVIAHVGFITWLWAVLLLALVLIMFGLYGVITAITRTRTMLRTYCVVAAILALIILIFLLLFWVKVRTLKALQKQTMKETFDVYRCHGWSKCAWDELQDKDLLTYYQDKLHHKTVGIE